jgi:hypothetical protein
MMFFIYLSGLEILTKMLKHVALFYLFVLLGFSFNANAIRLSHEVGVMLDLWLFNQITDSGMI